MKHLDLFSGIGGFALGLKMAGGFETVAFCEIDPYCQKVLKKNFPGVPIYDDVRTLDHDGEIDIITGGYPCQPFSLAGKRQGAEDDRHLWPFMFGLIQKHRPTWVIGENVAGHITMGLDDVLADMEGESYAVQTFIIPACATGAKHRRDRLWIVAHTKSSNDRRTSREFYKKDGGQVRQMFPKFSGTSEISKAMAHNDGKWQLSITKEGDQQGNRTIDSSKNICRTGISGRKSESGLGGSFDGLSARLDQLRDDGIPKLAIKIPNRVDRLKGLGNAVVPQVPEIIGRAIMEVEK